MSSTGYNPRYEYSARSSSYTVRVPAENLEFFLNQKDTLGTVTSSNMWQDDVTLNYYDNKNRLTVLETKKERLLDLLKRTGELRDIIELENALSQTIYEIESITGQLNRLDGMIAYSTVQVYISEVAKETTVTPIPKTLGERISATFNNTLEGVGTFFEGLLVFLIGYSPVFIILLVIALVIVIPVVISSKRDKRRAQAARNSINNQGIQK